NAKAVDVAGSDHELVRLKGKAEFRSLGKRYGKETPRAAAVVSQLTAEQLAVLEHGDPVRVGEFELRPEDVVVTREVVSDWAVPAVQRFVGGERLARKIVLGAVFDDADVTREIDIEARRVTIALRRHDGRKGGTR